MDRIEFSDMDKAIVSLPDEVGAEAKRQDSEAEESESLDNLEYVFVIL